MTQPHPLAPNLEAILADLMPAAQRLAVRRRARKRAVRLAAGIVAGLTLASSAAVAGFRVLGSPAPPAVRRDLRDVDRGMPRDLRLNPDVAHAHAVAASNDSIVYFAAIKGGGYCAELVTRSGPRGAVCSTAEEADSRGISVTIPFTDPVRADSPVTVSGRVASPAARSVELVYPDGGTDSVRLGEGGFFVADVPREHLAAVHERGLMLVGRDADAKPLAQAVVPSDAITPPSEISRPHDPIEFETVSTERDFTRVLGVHGRVYVSGVERITLRYPDGTTVRLALRGRRFHYAVPAAHQRDLMRPGTITAWGADGRALAERPVAAVAYWRGRERGG